MHIIISFITWCGRLSTTLGIMHCNIDPGGFNVKEAPKLISFQQNHRGALFESNTGEPRGRMHEMSLVISGSFFIAHPYAHKTSVITFTNRDYFMQCKVDS